MDLENKIGLVATDKAQLKLVVINLNILINSCIFFSSHVQLETGMK